MTSPLVASAGHPISPAVGSIASLILANDLTAVAGALAGAFSAVMAGAAGIQIKQDQEAALAQLKSDLEHHKNKLEGMSAEQIGLVINTVSMMTQEVNREKLSILREITLGAVSEREISEHTATMVRRLAREISVAQFKLLEQTWRLDERINVDPLNPTPEDGVLRRHLPRTEDEYEIVVSLAQLGLLRSIPTAAEQYEVSKLGERLLVLIQSGRDLSSFPVNT